MVVPDRFVALQAYCPASETAIFSTRSLDYHFVGCHQVECSKPLLLCMKMDMEGCLGTRRTRDLPLGNQHVTQRTQMGT
ncbi:hypothetical protein P5673_013604 [Acropora cervicornis]|uniref:Uncharacterized protein n=1 Tax=Acropora cervicornis TaxID=6130 RepID=A0AAD9QL18_ACRCE|nr:hypothetical protein P5673_013604 [Acropora cervicornis]